MPAQTPSGDGVASSNATVNTFLKTRQPSWMTGTKNTTARSIAPRQGVTQALQPQPVPSVLPSPAPSDEPSPAMSNPHDSPNAHPASLPEAQTTASSGPAAASPFPISDSRFVYDLTSSPTAASQEPPTTGGSNGAFAPAPVPQPQSPFLSNPQFRHHSSNGTTTASPTFHPVRSTASTTPNPNPRPVGAAAQGQVAVQTNHNPGSDTGQLSNAPNGGAPAAKRRRTDAITSSGQAPVILKYSSFIPKIDQHIQACGGEQGFTNEIERPRMQLLREACIREDDFFLALHQIYCLWSQNPAQIYQLLLRHQPAPIIDGAFAIIETVLKRNQDVSPGHLTFFANFPDSLHQLLHQAPTYPYESAINRVARFLSKLPRNFNNLTQLSLNRRYPYLVDELLDRLACYSPVLQMIFFTASRRRLGVPDGPLGSQIEHAFREDQKNHRSETTGIQVLTPYSHPQEIERRNAPLIKFYKAIIAKATSQPQSTHSPVPVHVSSPSTAQVSNFPTMPSPNSQYRPQPLSFGRQVPQNTPIYQPASASYSPTSPIPPALAAPSSQAQQQPQTAASPTGSAQYTQRQGLNPPVPMQYVLQSSMPGYQPFEYGPAQPAVAGQQPQQRMSIVAHSQWAQQQPEQQQQQQQQQQHQQHPSLERQVQQLQQIQQVQQHQGQHPQHRAQQPSHLTPRQLQQQMQMHLQVPHPELTQQMQQWNPNMGAGNISPQGGHLAAPQIQRPMIPTQQQVAQSGVGFPSLSFPPMGNGSPAGPINMGPSRARQANPTTRQIEQNVYQRHMAGRAKDPLLPVKGYSIPRPEWPYDPMDKKAIMMSLHQAAARSPKRAVQDPSERFYQAVKALPVAPTLVVPKSMLQTFSFQVTSEQFNQASMARRRNGDLLPSVEHMNGSLRWRLRCCAAPKANETFTEEQWATADMSWPPTIFAQFNGLALSIRRKTHNGKDLPAELTDSIIVGNNTLTISIPDLRRENDARRFLAVEIVETLSHTDIIDLVWAKGVLPESDTLQTIKKRLDGPVDDDDISVETPHMSINLADPFSSVIFKVPARGAKCTHMECFDLENWLDTRPSKLGSNCPHGQVECDCPTRAEPSNPDKWRCPICMKDARPYSLVIDGFLLKVREQLEEENKLHAKSMLVKADGTWSAILESDDDVGSDDDEFPPITRIGKPAAGVPTTPSVAAGRRPEVEVIELD
ncbi:hypothetical protein B0T19DRAFT_151515 [Cercophora scortea]|uniref:SP-RING-type domain-containing protein n=1 Tax=Cercophora scortea TaxID=314031 RepID=A0AAE0IMG2_9PEZI|nr:hypothetical protein B0T19DRAFT_151515 [Cercophora scortea]